MLHWLFEVAEGVYRIPARAANTYLIEAAKGLVLVDTGLPGSEKRILNALRKLGKRPEEIRLVLLTHRHPDHIGSVAALKRETSAILSNRGPVEYGPCEVCSSLAEGSEDRTLHLPRLI